MLGNVWSGETLLRAYRGRAKVYKASFIIFGWARLSSETTGPAALLNQHLKYSCEAGHDYETVTCERFEIITIHHTDMQITIKP